MSVEKEDVPFFSACSKFKKREINNPYLTNQAITFLYLRANNCDRQQAKKFCVRPQCKVDTTLKNHGPAGCRVLRTQEGQVVNHLNGWVNMGQFIKFDMGTDFETDIDLITKRDKKFQLQEEQLESQLQKLQMQKEILRRNAEKIFQGSEEHKFSLKDLSKQELMDKLQKLKDTNLKALNEVIRYTKLGDNILIEPVKLREEELEYQRRNQDSIISRLQLFKPTIELDPLHFKIKEKPSYILREKRDQTEDKPRTPKNEDSAQILRAHKKRESILMQEIFNKGTYVQSADKDKNSRTRFKSVDELTSPEINKQMNRFFQYRTPSGRTNDENINKLLSERQITLQKIKNKTERLSNFKSERFLGSLTERTFKPSNSSTRVGTGNQRSGVRTREPTATDLGPIPQIKLSFQEKTRTRESSFK